MLGSPVGHSLSPVLHRAAYAALGLDWTYAAVEVDAAGLPDLLDGLDDSWRGLSLTMPLKWAVLPLVDELDPVAVTVGAANTVVFGAARSGARRLRYAANTDVAGVAAVLAGPPAGSVLVLGAGATAASVLAAVPSSAAVTVLVREPGRAGRLREVAERLDRTVRIARFGDAVDRPDLLVSTLPGGALAADTLADAADRWLPAAGGTVFDVVYAGWPTPLARSAARAGLTVRSGLDLLVHQAVGQVELMTGARVDPAVLAAAAAGAASAAGTAAKS